MKEVSCVTNVNDPVCHFTFYRTRSNQVNIILDRTYFQVKNN